MAVSLIGAGISLVVLGTIAPFFLVLVPEVTGLVVLNYFTGKLRAIRPGLRPRWPWEVVRKDNYFSLELVTREVLEETYAAKDGPQMKVKWSIQYRPDEGKLTSYIAVDATTIEKGFRDVISSALSAEIANMDAEPARRGIKAIEQAVLRALEKEPMRSHGMDASTKEKLEGEYGVNFVLFKIADIDFSDDYQQARAGQARMRVITEAASKVSTGPDGKPTKDAINAVLVEQGKAKKNIFEVEGLTEVAGAIARAFRGGN